MCSDAVSAAVVGGVPSRPCEGTLAPSTSSRQALATAGKVPALHLLMEVVRDGFRLRDEQREHAFGFDGDDVVLILQDAFDGEEFLAG